MSIVQQSFLGRWKCSIFDSRYPHVIIEYLKYGIAKELDFYLHSNNSLIGQFRFRLYSTGNEGPTESFNHVDNTIRSLLKDENPKAIVESNVLFKGNLDRSGQGIGGKLEW